MPQAASPGADPKAPAFTLKVGAVELQQATPGGLDYLSIEDHCDMIGVAEFTLEAGRGIAFKDVTLGSDVEVSATAGAAGASTVLFKGYVVELRHALRQGRRTLTVLAMDPLCKLAATRDVRYWEESTDSSIASSLISEFATLGRVDSTSDVRPYVLMRNESVLHFLRRLAARNGYLLMASEGSIDFVAPQYSEAPYELDTKKVISIDYTITSQGIPKKLTVRGWDPDAKAKVEGVATQQDHVAIGRGDLLGGQSDGIWLEESCISDVLVTSQSDAETLAKAELQRMGRNFLRGRAVVEGDVRFRAGTRIRFTGFEEGFSPDVFVVSSRHRISSGTGYLTEIAFCSNTRA